MPVWCLPNTTRLGGKPTPDHMALDRDEGREDQKTAQRACMYDDEMYRLLLLCTIVLSELL